MLKIKNVGGVWYVWGKVKGRLIRRSTGYAVGPRKAEEHARHVASEIEHGIRAEKAGWAAPTIREYWRRTYRPTFTAIKRAPQMDDQLMAHVLPVWGERRLDQITQSDCVRLLQVRRQAFRATPQHKIPVKIAEGTVQRLRGFVQGFFQRAVDDGLIARNPWKGIERVRGAVRLRLVTEIEQAEIEQRLSPEFRRWFRCMLGTGVRLDEMRGVDPREDLDLDQRLLILRERRDSEGQLITRVKGGRSRVVPIPVDVVDDFRQQLAAHGRLWTQSPDRLRQVLEAACRARPAIEGRISRRGKVVVAQPARQAIPLITPHMLRHTFGWRYLRDKGGENIYSLARILGDTVAVVERHYAHLLKEDLRAAVDRVDLGLGGAVARKVVEGRFGR